MAMDELGSEDNFFCEEENLYKTGLFWKLS